MCMSPPPAVKRNTGLNRPLDSLAIIGLTQVELNEVVDIIEARYDELTQAWRTHFSG